jgi:GntR family transcriptional regulator
MFSSDGPELLYVVVADYLAAQVADGALKPGQRLPSERQLAESYGVAYMTVRRAMKELRERGVVVSVHGKGTFVAQPSN